MFCSECGAELVAQSKFCAACGTPAETSPRDAAQRPADESSKIPKGPQSSIGARKLTTKGMVGVVIAVTTVAIIAAYATGFGRFVTAKADLLRGDAEKAIENHIPDELKAAPSEAAAGSTYAAFLSREECANQLQLSKFNKTNGRKSGEGGYVMSFEAEIRVIQNYPSFEYCTKGDNMLGRGGGLKAGESRRIEGEIQFLKTEKGWKIGGLAIDYTDAIRMNSGVGAAAPARNPPATAQSATDQTNRNLRRDNIKLWGELVQAHRYDISSSLSDQESLVVKFGLEVATQLIDRKTAKEFGRRACPSNTIQGVTQEYTIARLADGGAADLNSKSPLVDPKVIIFGQSQITSSKAQKVTDFAVQWRRKPIARNDLSDLTISFMIVEIAPPIWQFWRSSELCVVAETGSA